MTDHETTRMCFFYVIAARSLPKVMWDAGVKLVAGLQQLPTAALPLQAVLDFLQGDVASADLL